MLQERGHGEVSAGEDIPLCSDAGMSPRCPCSGVATDRQCADLAGRRGSAGWDLETQWCLGESLTQVFLKVQPTLIRDFISQTPAGLRPQSHSCAVGMEGKMLSPAQLVKAAR